MQASQLGTEPGDRLGCDLGAPADEDVSRHPRPRNAVRQTEPRFRASLPRILFEGNYLWHDLNNWIRSYDLSPDGKRFLMIQSQEEPPPPMKIEIVLNWFEELKRLVPVEE